MSANPKVVYDKQCPVCAAYCEGLPEAFDLVDARQSSALRDDILNRQLDLDQGMVVEIDGVIHYGSQAMYMLATSHPVPGWRGVMNRLMFSTPRRAAFFYPIGKMARNIGLHLKGIEWIKASLPHNTIRHQLGHAWEQLDPNIQQRFATEPAGTEVRTYTGTMEIMRCSRAGWLFAHLTRVIGNPLSPYCGANVPMAVVLFKPKGKTGVCWQRTYQHAGQSPYIVTSTKRENAKGEMTECVGGGFGMKLKVTAEGGDLHFNSYRYFWSLAGLELPLPHWLSPGKTQVIHEDLGAGNFRFAISMQHMCLGETFYQTGIFRETP